jgi:hypothetical protein
MKLNLLNKLTITASLLLIASACEVNDIDPANRIPEDQAFANAARVQSTVIGVYESAQRGWYANAVDRGYPFGAAATAQGDMRGEDMYNDQLFYETTYVGSWTTSTPNNNGMWIGLFRVINRANAVLEGVDKAEAAGILTDVQAAGYRGEMLYLRALCYHELLLDFCRPYSDDPNAMGVPYRDFAIDLPEKVELGLQVGRGTVAETYARVLQDLDNAELFMGTTGGPFRATKGAAIALKTRVKLHMEDWAGVITEYTKLTVAPFTYALTAAPSGPFGAGNTTENIFSFQNSNVSNPGTNAALVNMYGSPGRNGRGLVKISPVIWKAPFWQAGDLRRNALMVDQHSTGIYTYKYKGFGTNDDPTPIIRHAEVLLNAAEAYARLTLTTEAITLLNRVRDRALPGGPSYDLAALGGNASGVIDGIINERRIEFLAEGKRWADIHRLSGEGRITGIPLKATTRSVSALAQYSTGTVTFDHALPYTSDLFIWPIPLTEVLNNPTLAAQQNPGY